ncbi:hypothetical protein SAMN05216232_2532 [Virgibacillus subterraneus]|uniref:DUF4263 domain-containing protein n=1 Tax=Virgibacillus subterraneus TaxID=621109 RepID=A0A1H9GAK8_9BACI|nr:hypothetical protein [Virgibacillus subterraneus]SEQ47127.1 hypothetical protein SAMN05216232_2532 [Virgibacillus subterraneus]
MKDWEKFEVESTEYLNEQFKHIPVSFVQEGGYNSYSSDIGVKNKGGKTLFSVEAKYSPCQSGQFVVKEEQSTYKLTQDSMSENSKYTREIIDQLNDNFASYSPKGQNAIDIESKNENLANWIKEHYKDKESYFVISSTKLQDFKAIVPIDDIDKYFDVSACIRRKRSGTSHISQKRKEESVRQLKEHYEHFNLNVINVTEEKKGTERRTLIEFDEKVTFDRSDLYFGDDFFLSPKPNTDVYYVKTRAKTNNLNVIFSLQYKGAENNFGKENLEKFINREIG